MHDNMVEWLNDKEGVDMYAEEDDVAIIIV
jgi:hypothetical protein